MKTFKDYFILLLIFLNLFILTSIAINYYDPTPKAYGQVVENDYILMPGNLVLGKQFIWVIDLKTHQVTNCIYNYETNNIDWGQISPLNSMP